MYTQVTNMNQQQDHFFERFSQSRLTSAQMFEIRGGKEDDDDEKTKGSTADRQDDGFN